MTRSDQKPPVKGEGMASGGVEVVDDFEALEREILGESFPEASRKDGPVAGPSSGAVAGPAPGAGPQGDLLDSLNEEMQRWEEELSRKSAPAPRVDLRRTPPRAARRANSAAAPAPAPSPAPSSTPTPPPAQASSGPDARVDWTALRFPAPRVYLYDPNPLIRNALEEEFRGARIGVTVARDSGLLVRELASSRPHREFAVVLLGSEQDLNISMERIVEAKLATPHAIVVFLSELNVSSVRKRAFESGAWGFLEKPVALGPGRPWDPGQMAKFRNEAVRVVDDLYLRHKAYFDAVVTALGRGD